MQDDQASAMNLGIAGGAAHAQVLAGITGIGSRPRCAALQSGEDGADRLAGDIVRRRGFFGLAAQL